MTSDDLVSYDLRIVSQYKACAIRQSGAESVTPHDYDGTTQRRAAAPSAGWRWRCA